MKTKTTFIKCLLIAGMTTPAVAQTTAYLDTNNVKALLNNNGTLFSTGTSAQYIIPKYGNEARTTIFTAEMWLGGLDENKQLHLAGQLYRQTGNDFYTGPVAKNYKATNYAGKYNKIWKLNKKQIDYHKINYNQSGYQMPTAISTWPGTGDTTNGVAKHLAPYIDVNKNGIYDPQNGDYPDIRGDQAVYFIFNDDTIHKETGGQRMRIETHCMAYAFDKPSDTALKNTTFINYTIYNRSKHNYDSVYLAHFMDFDIGWYKDDYVGCDSALSLYFGYNGAPFDKGGNGYNDPPYDNSTPPPAQGVVWLNEPLSAFVYFVNANGANNGNPAVSTDFYHYMKAQWRSGNPMRYGGNGDNTTGKRTHFMYPDSSNLQAGNGQGWSEATAGDAPDDRRGVGSVGPFTLHTNNKLCLDMALIFARATSGNNFTSVRKLRAITPSVKQFYTNQNYSCPFLSVDPYTGVNEILNSSETSTILLYPNPLQSDILNIAINAKTNEEGTIIVINLLGQELIRQKTIAVKGNNVYQIHMEALAKGMYVLNYNNGKSTITTKFVKQ